MTIPIKTLSTEEFNMDYFCFGSGERPLVILPGLSAQSVMLFADAVSSAYFPLQKDFTIYVLDRRRPLPKSYSILEMAQDTARALDLLGLKNVCLFGASQGGMIALELAASRHDLVRRLAVASTAISVSDTQYSVVEKWIQAAEANDAQALCDAFGKAVYSHDFYEKCKDILANAAKQITKEELRRFVILASAIKGYRFTGSPDDIRCPLLAVGSANDGVFGDVAIREIRDFFGGKKDFSSHVYVGYGHAVYDTAPDFLERLKAFFE